MKKKLVLKPVVLEFEFDDEGVIPTSSVDSRQEGAPKRVRRLSLTGEGVMFVAGFSPPASVEVVLVPPVGHGPTSPVSVLGQIVTGGFVPFTHGFPQVNPLAPDDYPLD